MSQKGRSGGIVFGSQISGFATCLRLTVSEVASVVIGVDEAEGVALVELPEVGALREVEGAADDLVSREEPKLLL